MKTLKVGITFLEEVLGSSPNNDEIYDEFIGSKAPDAKSRAEEIEAVGVDEVREKGKTIFPKFADGSPFVYDYQVRGFFKEACGALRQVKGTKSSEVKAFKKKVDNHIFVEPRNIPLIMSGMLLGSCQRPLRASTPQGERVSLANSETAPEGTRLEFIVRCLIDSDVELVKEWLEYGKLKGFGQWRNSGKGRFEVDYIEEID